MTNDDEDDDLLIPVDHCFIDKYTLVGSNLTEGTSNLFDTCNTRDEAILKFDLRKDNNELHNHVYNSFHIQNNGKVVWKTQVPLGE